MKQTFRLVNETVRTNVLRVIQALPIVVPGLPRQNESVEGLPRPKHPFLVTVQPEEKNRSLDQNARYWAILNQASLASGMDAEELHWVAKRKFLGYREVEFNGEVHEIPNSTARLNTEKFAAYCTQVESWLYGEGMLQWA